MKEREVRIIYYGVVVEPDTHTPKKKFQNKIKTRRSLERERGGGAAGGRAWPRDF